MTGHVQPPARHVKDGDLWPCGSPATAENWPRRPWLQLKNWSRQPAGNTQEAIQPAAVRQPASCWTTPQKVSTIVNPIKEPGMDTARLFQSGRSQAVRLPKAYRFTGTEVVVKRFGNGVLLLPADDPWQTLQAGLATFEPGFELVREQPETQQRDEIGQ
jgi:antitoxin VapB